MFRGRRPAALDGPCRFGRGFRNGRYRRRAASVSLAGVGNSFARVSFIALLRLRGAALSKPVGAGAEIR
jgi:hypothetical protein